MNSLVVSPAYGRDYPNAKAAVAAWNAGRDFVMHSLMESGTYVNKDDLGKGKYTHVEIRYDNQTKVAVVNL